LLAYNFAREEFELKDGRMAAAAEGGALSRILDFEFLSRTRVGVQSMDKSASSAGHI
jgi:hypothetical protein